MRSQCPVRTQMSTSMTESEKDSSSARVKRPQQPKEILGRDEEKGNISIKKQLMRQEVLVCCAVAVDDEEEIKYMFYWIHNIF